MAAGVPAAEHRSDDNVGMSLSVRPLVPADAERARLLGWEAFGMPASVPTEPATLDRPGMTWFGAFDPQAGDLLLARMIDREYDSWFGGALVPTSGIAGVTVLAEARGQGTLTPLFAETLQHARRRGALVSTLFPTAPGIYRRFGYELVAELATVQVPTTALAAVRAPVHTRTRRATVADVPAVRSVYERWASAQNGPLSRRGVSFPGSDEEVLGEVTAVSVAVDDQQDVVGYVSWHRGQGYDESAAVAVEDLLALTPDAYLALLRLLGSFTSVAPNTRIDTSGEDPVRLLLPTGAWPVREAHPYMLRVLDVTGAMEARPFASSVTTELDFVVEDDFLTDLSGPYRLAVRGGRADCSRGGSGGRVLSARGLALLYAGAQSCANLRLVGQLRGGDTAEDPDWDALFGGRQRHIRDYF